VENVEEFKLMVDPQQMQATIYFYYAKRNVHQQKCHVGNEWW
jgi:hypothetical protein